jgi:hypothetical protein
MILFNKNELEKLAMLRPEAVLQKVSFL